MKFQSFHNLFFNSKIGAFSRVTDREHHDSQITLTGLEAKIVINYFDSANIQIGNVRSNPIKASKEFRFYNTNEIIKLNIVYPKPSKAELRLYLSNKSGFKPNGGMIWFIFVNQKNELVIGYLDEVKWGSLDQYDVDDNDYSNSINLITSPKVNLKNLKIEGEIKTIEIKGRTTYQRNPKLAILRFEKSEYRCEINPKHETFTSMKSDFPFVEAHHLIPMKFQSLIDYPLDNLDNLISLCPNCHRAFHHAIIDEKIHYLNNIYEKRTALHKWHTIEDLKGFYNCIRV